MSVFEQYRKQIEGKNILVTGGTGTVGYELIHAMLPLNPKVIRVFSRDENKQFYLRDEFRHLKNVRLLIGDVRDADRLARAMESVDVVFHLAALKHVESCEYNPFEAMRTNIQGTQNVVDCALAAGVDHVIFSSTDKAVNPSNAMGVSKLMAEKLVVAADYYKGASRTIFNCVRFGNVLASSGSVLPIFISRIREGAAIEVTDSAMSRFIATFNQSIDLMFQSLAEGRGGEIFIRKMPVINIRDLAEVLIGEFASLYGYKDVEIKEIGPRAGEKLYEELLTEEEAARTMDWKDYLIVRPLIGNGDGRREGGKPFEGRAYTSRDACKLSRKELRELMYTEQVFSNPHLMAGAAKHRRLDLDGVGSSMKQMGVS